MSDCESICVQSASSPPSAASNPYQLINPFPIRIPINSNPCPPHSNEFQPASNPRPTHAQPVSNPRPISIQSASSLFLILILNIDDAGRRRRPRVHSNPLLHYCSQSTPSLTFSLRSVWWVHSVSSLRPIHFPTITHVPLFIAPATEDAEGVRGFTSNFKINQSLHYY